MSDDATTQLLERLQSAADPERVVLELTLDALDNTDPAFARCVRRCALPRQLHAEIVEVLNRGEEDLPDPAELLDRVGQLSFVLRRSDGDLVFHDTVRDLMLADWRSEENRAELESITASLVEYYEARHTEVADLERSLLRVSGVIRRASPDRHVQLTHALESRLLAPLIEAIYHASHVSVEYADDVFTRHVENYESAGRIGVCRSLVSTLRDRLSSIDGPEAANRLLWLRYWDARLLRAAGEAAEAEAVIQEIDPGNDIRLRMWLLGDLGGSLYERDRYREARDVYGEELEIARTTLADPWNLAVSYIRLGDVSWQSDELVDAVEYYEHAVEAASTPLGRNSSAECRAALNLAGVRSQLGRFQDAFDAAFHALHIARSDLPQDRSLQRAVAYRFMYLLAPWDPRLVDTLYDEARVVQPPQDAASAAVDTTSYLAALREGRRALTDDELAEVADRPEPGNVGAELLRRYLLEHAYHADARGDYESATKLYTAVLDDAEVTRLDRVNAQTWRGIALSYSGRSEEGVADLREAARAWDELGSASMVTVSQSYLAVALTRQGRLDEAGALLDESGGQATKVAGALAGAYYEAVGELQRARGHLDLAELAYREQFDALDRTKRLEAGRAAAAVADIAAQRADWETAGEWAGRAENIWREVAAAASYRQSVDEQEADRLSAGAIRIMASPDGELAAARDLLLSATERVPWNMWYAVNLAYAAAALGDWSDAADAIDRARMYAPLPIAALSRLLADFRLREASVLLSRGEAAKAAAVCRAVRLAAGPDLDPDRFALLALRAGDAEFTLGRVEAAAVEYNDALGAIAGLPTLRGSAVSRLAVVSAHHGEREDAAEFLRRGVDAFAEAGQGDRAWWAVANAVAEVAPAPEATLAEVLHQVFQELIEGGRVNTFSSSIEVAAPPDWRVAESFTFAPPDGAGNLVVVGEQLESPLTVDEYVELQRWSFGAGLDSFEEISTEHVRLPGGHDAVVRQFTWTTEDGVPITQFQACFVRGDRAYTATGTTITGTATLESTLLQLVRGLTLRDRSEAPAP